MAFPDTALDVHVQAFLDGWVDFGPLFSVVDDYYTDEYLDEYLGRLIRDNGRLPEQEISITEGRSDEAGAVDPASVTVTLWNHDGALTPGDPRSVWFPAWDRGCPFRILIGDTVVFWGEVSEIVVTFPQGDLSRVLASELGDLASVPIERLGYANVEVTASGILRRLNQRTKPLRSALSRRVTEPNNLPHVFDYFPMEDGTEASRLTSGLPESTAAMVFSGELLLASGSGLAGSKPLASVAEGKEALWFATVNGFDTSGVIEVFMKMPAEPDVFTTFRPIEVRTTGDLARLSVEVIQYAGDSAIRFSAFDGGGVRLHQSIAGLEGSRIFFQPNHLQMRLELSESGGNTEWALVWWSVTQGVDPGAGFSDTWSGTFGQVTAVGGGAFAPPSGGVEVGHLIVHDGIERGWLVGPDVGKWGEEARTRISRLCTEEHIPAVFTGGDDLRSMKMGAQRPLSLPDLLEECATADRGILCEQRDGFAVRYVHRRYRYNREPSMTLDAALSEIANPFTPTTDDQLTRNDVTATRTDGTSVRAFNQASIDKVGVYDEEFTVNVASDLVVRHIAGWQLHLGDDNGMRVPQLTIDLTVAPQLIDAWLAMRVGHEVRIVNPPPQLIFGLAPVLWADEEVDWDDPASWGEITPIDLVVQGWTETFTSVSWVVTLNCSPAAPWKVAKWGDPWNGPLPQGL